MNFLKKNLFSFIAFAIAAVFIGIIFKDIDFDKLQKGFANAHFTWIFLVFVVTILSYVIRAIRWNILFEPMNLKISNFNAFISVSLGYFFNLGIPRSGEIVRATSLYKLEEIPVEKSLATVVLERIVDLLVLLIFIGLNLIFNYEVFFSFLKMGNFSVSYSLIFAFFGGILLMILLFFLLRKKLESYSFYQKIKAFLANFYQGLLSIFKLKKVGAFLVYSLLLWLCYFMMTYGLVLAFEETRFIAFRLSIFVLVAGSLGVIFPAAGGLGYPIAQRFAFQAIFLSLGLSEVLGKEVGYTYGLLSYFLQIIATILLGIFAMYFFSKRQKRISH